MRLTGHYRGETTLLYLDHPPADVGRKLQAIPARDGPLTVLRAPGKIALRGVAPNTVHPLLIYTELIGNRDERARETAVEIRREFLRGLA